MTPLYLKSFMLQNIFDSWADTSLHLLLLTSSMAKLNLQLNEIWKPQNNLGIKFTCDDVARVVVRIVGRQTHAFELLHLHVVTILQE